MCYRIHESLKSIDQSVAELFKHKGSQSLMLPECPPTFRLLSRSLLSWLLSVVHAVQAGHPCLVF